MLQIHTQCGNHAFVWRKVLTSQYKAYYNVDHNYYTMLTKPRMILTCINTHYLQ